MPTLELVRNEIEYMRTQVARQRGEIRQLQRAGISTSSAEALLERMLNKIDELCAERDRLSRRACSLPRTGSHVC
jgi:phage shock protein A